MTEEVVKRLEDAISKFENHAYDERAFHDTLESIIRSITESYLFSFRQFLNEKENDLETIDFMINRDGQRSAYLKTISEIKDYLNKRIG